MKRPRRTEGARAVSYLTADLKRQVERAAVEMGVSISTLIVFALKHYLKDRSAGRVGS